MDWEAKIECDRCGTKATVVVLDSIPYCPKSGKPITPEEIGEVNERVRKL